MQEKLVMFDRMRIDGVSPDYHHHIHCIIIGLVPSLNMYFKSKPSGTNKWQTLNLVQCVETKYWGLGHGPMNIWCEFENIHWKLRGVEHREEKRSWPPSDKKKTPWCAKNWFVSRPWSKLDGLWYLLGQIPKYPPIKSDMYFTGR